MDDDKLEISQILFTPAVRVRDPLKPGLEREFNMLRGPFPEGLVVETPRGILIGLEFIPWVHIAKIIMRPKRVAPGKEPEKAPEPKEAPPKPSRKRPTRPKRHK